VNNSAKTQLISDVAADLACEEHVDWNRSIITATEDFAYMLETCPGAFINIGNAGTVGSWPCTMTISMTLHCPLEQVSSRA
jgi:hippurate hydrolase